MSILHRIRRLIGRGGAKNRMTAPDTVLCRAEDGTAQGEAEVLAFLVEEYERRRTERMPLERQWTLNADFYAGYQNCGINPESGEIQGYIPLREYEEQGSYNRIAPLIETRLASLRSVSCSMSVRPRTNEAEDCEKSSIATSLLRYAQEEGAFAAKKDSLLLLSELYGTAFILSTWNRDGGELCVENEGYFEDGDGAVDGENPPIAEGDLSYTVLTPYEVFPDDLTKMNMEEQESILLARVVSVNTVEDIYGVRVRGGDSDVYTLSAVAGGSISGQAGAVLATDTRKTRESVTLLTYFEKPSGRHPKGRLIIGAGDRLLWYSDLPYDEIPLVAVKSKEAAGQFFGRSVICDLIPLQRAYNGIKNKIHDYIRAVAANPMLVPEGSIPDIVEFATHGLPPGEIVEYNAERGRPEPLPPAPLPAELRYECERLASDMEYTAGVSQLMVVGRAPSGVTSGAAIENLRQIDNARLALSGENLRHAVKRLSVIWLKIYKRYVSGYRTLCISGANEAAGVLAFSGDDLNSYDLVFDVENELILSPEQQRENFLAALQLGLFNDEQGRLPRAVKSRARRLMQVGGEADLVGCDELQMQAAERENGALTLGTLPEVGLFDDHELHIEAHKKFILQARFAYLRRENPAAAAAMEKHIFTHMLRARQATKKAVADSETTT